jgi:hypothetical protein
MRKTVLFFVVLFMTVPAMAVSDVNISCAQTGNGEVTVSYTSTENLIRAFGLDITVDNGANITDVCALDTNYRIYPGQIEITDGNVTDYNKPYASDDIGDANVTVEMGSLYTEDVCYAGDPNAGYNMKPGLSGTLLKFYVDDECNYVVTENEARGGVVMEDPNEEPNVILCSGSVEPPMCIVPNVVGKRKTEAEADIIAAGLTVGAETTAYSETVPYLRVISQNPTDGGNQITCGLPVDMVISDGSNCYVGRPNYAQWTAVGRPRCWCYPRQCHADGDGLQEGKAPSAYYVWNNDLTILTNAWMKTTADIAAYPEPNGCADFDRKPEGKAPTIFEVWNNDLTILTNNWMQNPDANCLPGNR